MQSNILLFLLFSLLVALIIRFIPAQHKKYGLLLFNTLFYLLCDFRFFGILALSIVWSFFIGQKLNREDINRKVILCLGILPILASLCFFKYYDFFIPKQEAALRILMPLGISYFTFKIISHLADIYFCRQPLSISFTEYAVYIGLFPQMICGPISRSYDIAKQLSNLKPPSYRQISNGFQLILSGLFKKLVIADRLSPYVNTIYSNPSAHPSLALWMAAFFYTIQIYCDFAGYSEIAIGAMNLLGIECKSNFQLPYFSYNIKDFWRRWHISLSSWLKDYIYIPLGGNRKGNIIQTRNILITFFISGLWHGNGINYIVWGLYHGIFNLLSIPKANTAFKQFLQTISTFFIVLMGWILFRATTLKDGLDFIFQMFVRFRLDINTIIASVLPFTGDFSCLAYLLCICLFIFILFIFEFWEYTNKIYNSEKETAIRCSLYLICVIFFGVIGQNSFLYANF